MKKLLAVLLCLSMLLPLTALAESESVELTFWIRTGDAFLEDQVAAYMAANPQVKITLEPVGSSYGDLRTKFSLGIQSGELPDISIAGWSGIGTLYDAGAIVDIASLEGSGEVMSDVIETFAQRCLYKDATIAIPYQVSSPVMYYNKTMLDAAGIAVPNTFDELKEAAAACVQKNDAGETTVYGFTTASDINWYICPMIYNFGGSFFDEEGNVTLTTDAHLKLYTWWADMVKIGALAPNQHATAQEDFCNGAVAFMFHSCASYRTIKEAVGDAFELGVAYFPGQESQQVNMGGNGIIMFTRDEARQQAALDLIAYLLQPEQLSHVVENSGYLPISRSLLNSDLIAQRIAGDANLGVIYDQVNRMSVFIQHAAYSTATAELTGIASEIEAYPDADIMALLEESQAVIDEYMADYE